MTVKTKITATQQKKALAIVATYLGPQMGYEGSAPTGQDAAYQASGPMLNPTWDWPSSGPTPTILLEGGPEEWAYDASGDAEVQEALGQIGVWCEPYASYALCLYPI